MSGHLPKDNKGQIKCTVCGGYTLIQPREGSPYRCPSCNGTGISQKPSHLLSNLPKAKAEDLDLP